MIEDDTRGRGKGSGEVVPLLLDVLVDNMMDTGEQERDSEADEDDFEHVSEDGSVPVDEEDDDFETGDEQRGGNKEGDTVSPPEHEDNWQVAEGDDCAIIARVRKAFIATWHRLE